jgi:hypothetical protein
VEAWMLLILGMAAIAMTILWAVVAAGRDEDA